MKNIFETLENRQSNRNFTGKMVDYKIVREAIEKAQKTATHMNGQQISVVITKDKETIKEIQKINWNQKHIADASYIITFVVDYNKTLEACRIANKEHVHHNDIESLLVGGIDAGLIAQSIELILQSQGIGTCFLGLVRLEMLKVKELLNIDGLAFPVLSMAIGDVENFDNDSSKLRPRMSYDSFIFDEKYDVEKVISEIQPYDDKVNAWWAEKGLDRMGYIEKMSDNYSHNYSEKGFEELQEIGFLNRYNKIK